MTILPGDSAELDLGDVFMSYDFMMEVELEEETLQYDFEQLISIVVPKRAAIS